MNTFVILVLALACQAIGQVMVDNFDPRIPRPGATLPASIDPYGFSRPLPPSIDPLGISYRPAHAGAVLPALYDPLGASRPGGLPFALDPVGYTRTNNGGYGGFGGYGGYGGYGGTYGGAYDAFLARPAGFLTGVGGNPIFPDPNAAVPLLTGRVPGTPLPPPTVAMPVMPVPVAPVAPVAPVVTAPPVTYSVNPVNVPVNPMPTYNTGAVAPAFPSGNLPFGNGGLGNLPGFSGNLPVGGGNLPLGSGTRPLNSGTGISGGSSTSVVPNGSFLPPV